MRIWKLCSDPCAGMPTSWPFLLWKLDPLPKSCPHVSSGIPHTQLCVVAPTLHSNKARRQRPDYLHWPCSVSLGRLPRHSCTESYWHGEREKKGGRKQALAPVSRPSSAGWWMSRTSWSLPPKPVESGYNELQSLENPPDSCHRHHQPPFQPALEPQSPPENLSWPASPPCTNTGGLSWTAPSRLPATTSFAPSTFDCDCRFHPVMHTLRSNHKLAQVVPACPFITHFELLIAGCCNSESLKCLAPDCTETAANKDANMLE